MTYDLQTDRLYQENVIYTNRLNLLLIGESMLLVSYVSALNLDITKKWILWVLPVTGILITFIFCLIIWDHSKYITSLHKKIIQDFPDVDILKKNPVSAITNFLSLMIPSIFIAIWIVFLILYII